MADPSHPDNEDHNTDIMQSYLDGSTSVDAAASQIATPIDAAYSSGSETTEGKIWGLWEDIISRVREDTRPATQEKAVALLAALKARADPSLPQDRPDLAKEWVYSSGKLWTELSLFGAVARDSFNLQPSSRTPPSALAQEKAAWIALNSFLARLSAQQVCDFDLYAIWALRDALETGDGPRTAPSAQDLDAAVPAAAAWVELAGPRLHAIRTTWPDNNGGGNPAQGGQLWSGAPGFDTARWTLWRERFQRLADGKADQDVVKETRDAAASAVRAMQAAEEGAKDGVGADVGAS